MIETETPVIVVILLSSCLGLLLVVLVSIYQLSKKLARIENQLSRNTDFPNVLEQVSSSTESPTAGAFDAFLGEDPARRNLTKAEQFAAYRKWRQQNGMNWSNS